MGEGVIPWLVGIGIPLLYGVGLASAIDAVMKARTPQGSTAWAVAHLTVPFFSLPLYWLFGRSSFDDYVDVLRDLDADLESRLEVAREGPLRPWLVRPDDESNPRRRAELRAFEALSTLSFTRGNGTPPAGRRPRHFRSTVRAHRGCP